MILGWVQVIPTLFVNGPKLFFPSVHRESYFDSEALILKRDNVAHVMMNGEENAKQHGLTKEAFVKNPLRYSLK